MLISDSKDMTAKVEYLEEPASLALRLTSIGSPSLHTPLLRPRRISTPTPWSEVSTAPCTKQAGSSTLYLAFVSKSATSMTSFGE